MAKSKRSQRSKDSTAPDTSPKYAKVAGGKKSPTLGLGNDLQDEIEIEPYNIPPVAVQEASRRHRSSHIATTSTELRETDEQESDSRTGVEEQWVSHEKDIDAAWNATKQGKTGLGDTSIQSDDSSESDEFMSAPEEDEPLDLTEVIVQGQEDIRNEEQDDASLPILVKPWMDWGLKKMAFSITEHQADAHIGNELYDRWLTDESQTWYFCTAYDAPFDYMNKPPSVENKKESTWDEVANMIYQWHENDIQQFASYVRKIFRQEKHQEVQDHLTRSVVMGIVQQDPAEVFRICELDGHQMESLYWNGEDGNNPTLRLRPLSLLWMIGTRLFDQPWANENTALLELHQHKEVRRVTRKKQALKTTQQRSLNDYLKTATPQEVTPGSIQRKKQKQVTILSPEEANVSMALNQANREGQPAETARRAMSQPAGKRRQIQPPRDIGSETEEMKEGTSSKQVGRSLGLGSGKASKVMTAEKGASGKTAIKNPYVKRTDHVKTTDENATANMEIDQEPIKPKILSYATAARTSEENHPITQEEKVAILTQMNVAGFPCHHVCMFVMTFDYVWGGTLEAAGSMHTKVKDTILRALKDAAKTTKPLILLPIKDQDVHDRSLWIMDMSKAEAKIDSWDALEIYLDRSYGNRDYMGKNLEKPGPRSLRTRLRFGFNSPRDLTMRNLNSSVRATLSTRSYCGRSPIQFGSLVRTGYLSYLPEGINRSTMENILMRRLDYKAPIGLEHTWVSNIGLSWNKDQKGIQQWHVYTTAPHAETVDAALAKWLNNNTLKMDFPYGAQVRYVHDAYSLGQGMLSQQPRHPIKSFMNDMKAKVAAHAASTEMVYSPIELHGMLAKVGTTHYGELSLLKLLYAIKATPAQTRKADQAMASDSSSTEDEEEGTSPDGKLDVDEVFTKVQRRRKKSLPQTKPKKSNKNKKGPPPTAASDFRPAPLFLSIFPAEHNNMYVFTVRKEKKSLATNILRDLAPFLAFHLRERSPMNVLKFWMDRVDAAAAFRKGKVWCPETLQAQIKDQKQDDVDPNELYFLEDDMDDTTDMFDGILEIDLAMSTVKDIDDGATVTGYMEDLQRLKEATDQLEKAAITIETKDSQLAEQDKKLKRQAQELEALRQLVAKDSGGGSPRTGP